MKKHPAIIWMLLITILSVALGAYAYLERPFSTRMSAFVTDLRGRSDAQRSNILRAARPLHEKVLQPGEIFSLNQSSGPYTEARGYLPERSIRGKEIIWSPGGGVCQVASTLYNTAKAAGLVVLERVPHSQSVTSVPPGLDATVVYGVADLKISNPHPFPVKLMAQPSGGQLLVEIRARQSFGGNHE